MGKIECIEIDVFALVILFVIFVNTYNRPGRHLFEQKLFSILLYSNFGVLCSDAILWGLNGMPNENIRILAGILTVIYYIFNILPCIVWSIYAHYQVYRDEKASLVLLMLISPPAVFGTLICAASYFNGLVFYFDSDNRYFRGNLYPVIAFICLSYLLFSLVLISVKRKSLEKNYFTAMIIFIVPPFIGGVIQYLFYGISLVWICTTVSILIIFINIQNNQLYTDHLTGLYNRRQLDYYFHSIKRRKKRKKLLAGIMIDLDCFKQINDKWGHGTGDAALVDVGEILNKSFGKSDLVCRFGGDEFIAIMEINQESELLAAIKRIRINTAEIKNKRHSSYNISLSIGYDIYDWDSEISIDDFIEHIDSLMYEDKRNA
ncbi:GGDEF domain-containing protein [Clostridium oryzae]|uniref:Diguanylate cyclase DosC n=1 Tax=Clostridium oryzae TaxID=1450648 RepID=A0A1V4IM54_9CLOT|nr:GGDEF domain-containing protein [Clostridium oryzae]OPJ60949.1 diguanylate cyclase DosC [Clostridium oryzae]